MFTLHRGLVPFSLLERKLVGGVELRQLMPVYALTLDHFSGVFSAKSAETLFDQLFECVSCLHRVGFLHCDIKPSNIAIDHAGQAVLIDTGSLVPTGSTCKSCTWVFVPEDLEVLLRGGKSKASNAHNIPEVFDWWMLAVTMRCLLIPMKNTGIQPSSMSQVKKDLSNCPEAIQFWQKLDKLLTMPIHVERTPGTPQGPINAPCRIDFFSPAKDTVPTNIPDRFWHRNRSPVIVKKCKGKHMPRSMSLIKEQEEKS